MKKIYFQNELKSIRDRIEFQRTNKALNKFVDIDELFKLLDECIGIDFIYRLVMEHDYAVDNVEELKGIIEELKEKLNKPCNDCGYFECQCNKENLYG